MIEPIIHFMAVILVVCQYATNISQKDKLAVFQWCLMGLTVCFDAQSIHILWFTQTHKAMIYD